MRLEWLIEKSQHLRKQEVELKHDQWFTRPDVLEKFASWVKQNLSGKKISRIIDPSAGDGQIGKYFPSAEMYDIDPKGEGVQQADFNTQSFRYQPGTLVVMNPPYGSKSAEAIRWFNKAAMFADHIAIIAPASFQRDNIKNVLDHNFQLIGEWRLPPRSFYWPAEGKMRAVDVGAVAQVWSRSSESRQPVQLKTRSEFFDFVTPEEADFAILRKGRQAGRLVSPDGTDPRAHHYIRAKDSRVRKAFELINWEPIASQSVAVRNLSKPQIVRAVEELLL